MVAEQAAEETTQKATAAAAGSSEHHHEQERRGNAAGAPLYKIPSVPVPTFASPRGTVGANVGTTRNTSSIIVLV